MNCTVIGICPIPNCQGKPADLKAEIAGLHTLLDPRLVALLAQIIPTFGKRAYIAPAAVVHHGAGGAAVAQLLYPR